MTTIPIPSQVLEHIAGATIITGPWPSYASFSGLPEHERWAIYELAKAGRLVMEAKGFTMGEAYDQFVRRVTAELEI